MIANSRTHSLAALAAACLLACAPAQAQQSPVRVERRREARGRHGRRKRHRSRQEAAEPDRRSLQLPVPEQHQLRRRTSSGDAGNPEYPAGHPDPRQRRLERHHPHHSAGRLEPGPVAAAKRAGRHGSDRLFPRSCRRRTRRTGGYGARAQSSRSRPAADPASAPTSGAPGRPPRSSTRTGLGSSAASSTTSGRSAERTGRWATLTTIS